MDKIVFAMGTVATGLISSGLKRAYNLNLIKYERNLASSLKIIYSERISVLKTFENRPFELRNWIFISPAEEILPIRP